MKDYVPSEYQPSSLTAVTPGDLLSPVGGPVIVRRARVSAIGPSDSKRTRQLTVAGLERPLLLNSYRLMRFGTESITIGDYLDRVIEVDDLVDIIADQRFAPPLTYVWIHIEYLDESPSGLYFSRKDDGLFALRTKSGEKAERLVASQLVTQFHHRLPPNKLKGPGTFQITYKNKRVRAVDLTCLACNLSIEVKKRNRDRRYRVSHSPSRPFDHENTPAGWHAFVFPDLSIHWVSNRTISALIRGGAAYLGSDRYDAWAELDPSRLCEADPPLCTHG